MAENQCDICHSRPATVRVRVSQNGLQQVMNICEPDYRRLQQVSSRRSPFESLFGADFSGFGDFFGDDELFAGGGKPESAGSSKSRSRTDRPSTGAINLLDYFSDQAKSCCNKLPLRLPNPENEK